MPKLDYNFKPSYESLPTANVDIRVTDRTNNPVLTAYAGELGKLTVVPVFLSASPDISNLNYKIDLGDGTISKNLSATHYYNTPGEYKITLVVTTSSGDLRRGNLPKNIIATCANDGCGHPITDIQFYTIVDDKVTNVDHKGWLMSKEHHEL